MCVCIAFIFALGHERAEAGGVLQVFAVPPFDHRGAVNAHDCKRTQVHCPAPAVPTSGQHFQSKTFKVKVVFLIHPLPSVDEALSLRCILFAALVTGSD